MKETLGSLKWEITCMLNDASGGGGGKGVDAGRGNAVATGT